MGAADAAVYAVVGVLLLGQAQSLQGCVGLCLGESAQCVIAVLGSSQVASDLGDVACSVVLVACGAATRSGYCDATTHPEPRPPPLEELVSGML